MIDRLSKHFPDANRDHITETVRDGYSSLAGRRIRAYVPNLVEHGVRTRLRREARIARSSP
ncbi:three-helix bundle dimerization domain-containing protein [Cryobacterium breve]|uniref:three-helix bundle dimerization domain-containing protein n=1 Tax=Cryobacterium breve TaxID=1259258 RepID=UPI003D7C2BBF